MNRHFAPDSRSAPYYDLIYSFIDFEDEARRLVGIAQRYHPNPRSLLDVACGTHAHARFLLEHFDIVDGLDINSEFLRQARNKNPRGQYYEADMRTFDLGVRYDVIWCLHSSVGYLKDESELTKCLGRMSSHVKPGGLLMIEPWFSPETFANGRISLVTAEDGTHKVARMSRRIKTSASSSLMEFHFIIAGESGIESFIEHHQLALFTKDQITLSFDLAGFDVVFDESYSFGRGLYVGKRRP